MIERIKAESPLKGFVFKLVNDKIIPSIIRIVKLVPRGRRSMKRLFRMELKTSA